MITLNYPLIEKLKLLSENKLILVFNIQDGSSSETHVKLYSRKCNLTNLSISLF